MTPPAAAPSASTERLQILVIDDDENVASTVALLLSRDHEVTTTTDGESGLELALSGRFDLILSDLLMPHISGRELFQRIQAQGTGLEARLVFMTGGATNRETQQFLDNASARILHKPFSIRDLRELIGTIQQTRSEKVAPAV